MNGSFIDFLQVLQPGSQYRNNPHIMGFPIGHGSASQIIGKRLIRIPEINGFFPPGKNRFLLFLTDCFSRQAYYRHRRSGTCNYRHSKKPFLKPHAFLLTSILYLCCPFSWHRQYIPNKTVYKHSLLFIITFPPGICPIYPSFHPRVPFL